MPPRASRQLPREALQGFLGVNLRLDSLSMADTDVVRAINADLHRRPGVFYLRQGRTSQTTLPTSEMVRMLAKYNGQRYQYVTGTLYKNGSAFVTALTGPRTTVLPARPLNDTTTWLFVANAARMTKFDGTNLRTWGIDPPGTAVTVSAGAAGSLTGAYGAVYTYARLDGTAVAHESNPSPDSNTVTLASQVLSVPVVASADAQVGAIRVYRTLTGGTTYLFDQQVANTTATITSSQADSGLGSAVEEDNDVPPLASIAAEFQNHLFLAGDADNPHYLWYSKRFRPEAVGADQFLELGNPYDGLNALTPLTGVLGAFTRLTKYRVIGNSVSGFAGLEALNTRGTPAPQAALATAQGALFLARDGVFLTNFVQADEELSAAIQGLFADESINGYAPIDWTHAGQMSLAQWKRRIYFGYRDTMNTAMLAVYSLDTQRWYHYTHDACALLVEEDVDQLVMGDSTGGVWILEDGVSDAGGDIEMTVVLPERAGGNRWVLKRFDFLQMDATIPSGTLTVTVRIDGAIRHQLSITGTRQRTLHRMPARCLGYTWQVECAYRGHAAVQLAGVQMAMFPMEGA